MTKYEYHVDEYVHLKDVVKDIDKRAADGWRIVAAYPGHGQLTKNFKHVYVYERERPS